MLPLSIKNKKYGKVTSKVTFTEKQGTKAEVF